ncbi:MAG: hypothetical protein ABJB74_12515 [Gemmatimonas sp.]
MATRSRVPEVHKFGGASLADAKAVRHALDIIASRTAPAVTVVSALAGVTDALLALAASAVSGARGDPQGDIAAVATSPQPRLAGHSAPTAYRFAMTCHYRSASVQSA